MKEIKIGIVGLGRLGKIHATNIALKIPGVKLTAACSLVGQELEFARQELKVHDLYTDYSEMIKHAHIDAVAIVSTSDQHCEHIQLALQADKHVFCEKPLGISADECLAVLKAVDLSDKVFMLGFMRRFDPSYAYAKEKILSGAIGEPYMMKAASIDPDAQVAGCLQFVGKGSGGLFVDMGIHDIDLMRWFLNEDPEEVYAIGGSYKYKEFETAGDAEAGIATYAFASGKMATIHAGRCALHGYHIETEIIGTEGSIRVSPVPQKNLAVMYNAAGAVVECVGSFPERFESAYLLEVQEFVDCVRLGKKPSVTAEDGIKTVQIASATAKAFLQKNVVKIQY